jgi:parallel beta-helix repeat protein
MLQTRIILAAIALICARDARAVDGVIEINHARALAGGVTAGDTAGYPVTISASGSYRLTGNLTVPANTTAIQIIVSTVTLDLGGFEVKGPNTCSNYPVTGCTATGGAAGILATSASAFLVTVRNGRVSGMAGECVDLQGSSAVVEQVLAYLCGSTGIRVAAYGRVSDSVGLQNFGSGISVGTGGEARGNSGSGISVGAGVLGATLTANRALQNGGAGISAGDVALVTGNRATGNVGTGILAGSGSTVSENTVSINNGDGIATGLGSSVHENTVSNNGGGGIVVEGRSTVIGNTIRSNARCGLTTCESGATCRSGFGQNTITDNNGASGNRQAAGQWTALAHWGVPGNDPDWYHNADTNLCSNTYCTFLTGGGNCP